MDCCLYSGNPRFSFATLPAEKHHRPITFRLRIDHRPLIVLAATSGSNISKCEFGGLNGPLELRTPSGRFLSGTFFDDRDNFQFSAREQLKLLAAERDEGNARMRLSRADEASLHRRVAELKRNECQIAVEDVMYMLIFYKFSEIGVQLVPRLSKCLYNGRLEIWPSRDWELESIHSFEVREMVREHLRVNIGWSLNLNPRDSCVITEINRFNLHKLYAASILYGYFLKSASLRHCLECACSYVSENFSLGYEYIAFGCIRSSRTVPANQITCGMGKRSESFKCYVMGFDQETVQMCAKPKSKEAVNLIERYSCALFGDEKTGLLETDELISTSLASLKRFVLEAVALGSFLWEAEKWVNTLYLLEEN